MAIDIRATVTCSLGTLISGSISDDYLQGSGLVKTRGSCEISALITPAVGTVVTFSYTKGGVTRSIPRTLRVLSSFADPFRRTTKVELGCKLTYLSDLQEPVTWDAFDDPENDEYDDDDQRIVTLPIYASSVMAKCLTELGITASSSPLTNKFSIAEFDFGGGYVQVLSNLLVSESYYGYLNASEVLQIASLDQDSGTGPVYTSADIVDLGSIGTGQLPGEAVTVSYSTLKLKQPEDNTDSGFEDNNASRLWERSVTVAGPNTYYVGSKVFTGTESTETLTTYSRIGNSDVPIKRVTTETASTAKIAGSIGAAYDTNGIGFNAITATLRREEELITYDQTGNKIRNEVTQYEQALAIFGGVSLNYVFSPTDFVNFNYVLLPSAQTISTYEVYDNLQQETSSSYVLWPQTITGQQAVAEYRETLQTSADVSTYVNAIAAAGLVHERTAVSINTVGIEPGRPTDIFNASYAKGGDPNNGWRTESTADLELALGSATAQRRIEFSLPYAADDIFSGPSGGPFTATPSDASAKANRYGRVQNRLLLGNRSGINLQVAPERMPVAPFEPIYVQANGLTALYRANGNQWAFDSNGIICSTDALFWGAVGGTGTFWFPVAPGITTLPTTPAIIDGEMNATTVVLPYNETAVYDARIRLSNVVTKFNYSLSLLTVISALTVKTKVVLSKVIVADAGSYALSGQAASSVTNRILTGASAAFILTGQEALFIPAILTADVGAYVLSGQDADLLKPLSIQTGTQAPLLGAGGATSSTGWNLVQNADADDASLQVTGWPFTFTLNSVGYTSTFVGSNSYLTFGSESTDYSDLSASIPPLPKIMFGASDNSYQRVYTKAETAGSDSVMRIRYEGTAFTTGVVGSPTIVVEFAFYAPRVDGAQWVELRVGNHSRTNGVFNIANSNTAYASSTITANSSWVFVGNSAGTSWTLTSNRYVA